MLWARPKPTLALAMAPANSSIFDRFYKVFRLGEPHVPSCGNDTGFIRVWGRFFDHFRSNDMEIMEMIQVFIRVSMYVFPVESQPRKRQFDPCSVWFSEERQSASLDAYKPNGFLMILYTFVVTCPQNHQ